MASQTDRVFRSAAHSRALADRLLHRHRSFVGHAPRRGVEPPEGMRVLRPRKWHLDDRGPQVPPGAVDSKREKIPRGDPRGTRGSSSKRQHARSRSPKTSTTNHCCFLNQLNPPPPTEIQESAPVAVARAPEWGRHKAFVEWVNAYAQRKAAATAMSSRPTPRARSALRGFAGHSPGIVRKPRVLIPGQPTRHVHVQNDSRL